jgi:hypothetical protein
MAIDLETLSSGQLENLIANHRRKRAIDAPLCIDALRELEKRKGKGLDLEMSLSIILQAARKARFVSYRELADANGADWSQVRYAIGGHLWKLAEYGHLKERLLLSAIVVNKPIPTPGKWNRTP